MVPHHYFIWDLMQRASTLLPAMEFASARDAIEPGGPSYVLEKAAIADWQGKIVHFGDHVAFEKPPLAVGGQDWG